MKKFSFRLEKIRKYKQQIENDIKLQLATERARMFVEAKRLDDLNAYRTRYYLKYGIKKVGRVNVRELMAAKMFLDKLTKDVKRQAEVLDKARLKVNEVQKKLGEASRERKKYDKLKEKAKALYDRESIRLETKELDEFGSQRRYETNSVFS